jgi:FKBP-type peptidyl-prolyl cis-trans isomerase (trigger factor)
MAKTPATSKNTVSRGPQKKVFSFILDKQALLDNNFKSAVVGVYTDARKLVEFMDSDAYDTSRHFRVKYEAISNPRNAEMDDGTVSSLDAG